MLADKFFNSLTSTKKGVLYFKNYKVYFPLLSCELNQEWQVIIINNKIKIPFDKIDECRIVI